MKKIALFAAMILCAVTTAMASNAEASDSVFVVKYGEVVGKYEITEGDYITFTRPTDTWHVVKKTVTFDCRNYDGTAANEYTWTTSLWQYGTENSFYIENFLNSGSGMYFKIDQNSNVTFDGKDPSTWYGNFVPTSNVYESTSYGSAYYNYYTNSASYYWDDTANGLTNTQFAFYGSGYSKVEGSKGYFYLGGYLGDSNTFINLYGSWK